MYSEKIKEKQRETCFKNYGVSNPSQSVEIQKRKEETCLEHFGVTSPMYSEEVRLRQQETCLEHFGVRNPSQSAEIQKRKEETCLANYGVRCSFQSTIVKAKIRAQCLKWYGVSNPSQSPEIQRRKEETCLANYGVRNPIWSPVIRKKAILAQIKGGTFYSLELREKLSNPQFWQEEYVEKKKPFSVIAEELGINASNLSCYFQEFSGLTARTPGGKSYGELELLRYVNQFIFAESRSFKSLGSGSNLFLDIYIPELKIAFEYNGLYWHSEEFKPRDYHLEKTLECEKLGIRLIHIWEDDWLIKREILEKKIRSWLGLETEKVFARKCSIVVPTKEQRGSFYELNHIKGDSAGSIAYALEFQGTLVAMITFKDMGQGTWDLNRFATSCSVPGGFSRLLEHFKRNNQWSKIYTYADRCISQGNLYAKIGFKLTSISAPAYHGIERYKRRSHWHYTAEKLKARFPQFSGTQFEIMDQAKIPRIWDCGQLRFELFP
jgi:hypothetical protein